jgi:hypothetical protein
VGCYIKIVIGGKVLGGKMTVVVDRNLKYPICCLFLRKNDGAGDGFEVWTGSTAVTDESCDGHNGQTHIPIWLKNSLLIQIDMVYTMMYGNSEPKICKMSKESIYQKCSDLKAKMKKMTAFWCEFSNKER